MIRTDRSAAREKLAYYLLGVGLGCILLGLFVLSRQRAILARTPPGQGAQAPAQPPSPTPAPTAP